eukprot:9500135-Pyramimonas_sp.AAC.1
MWINVDVKSCTVNRGAEDAVELSMHGIARQDCSGHAMATAATAPEQHFGCRSEERPRFTSPSLAKHVLRMHWLK